MPTHVDEIQDNKSKRKVKSYSPRILHYVNRALPIQVGYTIRTHYIVANLKKMGYLPSVCTRPGIDAQGPDTVVGHEEAYLIKDDVPYFGIRPDYFSCSRFHPIVRSLSEMGIRGVGRLMRNMELRLYGNWLLKVSGKPDIIHAHSPPRAAREALSLSRRWHVPLVYEIRGFWGLSGASDNGTFVDVSKAAYKDVKASEKAGRVVAICRGIADVLVQNGISFGKIDIVPNGVDVSVFHPLDRDERLAREIDVHGKLVYGYATNIRRLEGLQDVIRAWKKVTDTLGDAVFLVFGEGKYTDALKKMVRENGVGETFRFVGQVPHAKMQAYYSLLDVFVIPRIPEPVCHIVTPLKPLEAMAMGIPVIASDVSALREMVQDGETGVLFEAGNIDSLADVCIEVGKNDRLRRELSLKARQWVEAERDWTVVTSRYRSVYDSLCH